MRKFKSKNKSKVVYVLIFVLSFIFSFIFIVRDKTILFDKLVSEITRSNKKILDFSFLVSPKEIIYSSLNKNVEKNDLKAFNSLYYDEFDYLTSKSNYVIDPSPDENKSEPIVYLYNTHQTEEYSLNSTFDYSVKPNVMISSYILREKLNNLGINTIVETNNMKEFLVKNGYKYNMSYHASEYFARLKEREYPSIRYLFDIHRDSLGRNSTVLEINDKKYAKVLFVVGLEHTTKDNNVGFAEKLDMETNNLLRGLSRGVSYKTGEPIHGVYNQNLFGKSVLIEVGGVDNTIEEVNNTMEILSKVIESVVKEEMNA